VVTVVFHTSPGSCQDIYSTYVYYLTICHCCSCQDSEMLSSWLQQVQGASRRILSHGSWFGQGSWQLCCAASGSAAKTSARLASTQAMCCCLTPAAAAAAGEEDGFLLVYVYEASADASFLHVYNAQTMDSKPLAVVSAPALPEFAGFFCRGSQRCASSVCNAPCVY
jgi:hypothetical protein